MLFPLRPKCLTISPQYPPFQSLIHSLTSPLSLLLPACHPPPTSSHSSSLHKSTSLKQTSPFLIPLPISSQNHFPVAHQSCPTIPSLSLSLPFTVFSRISPPHHKNLRTIESFKNCSCPFFELYYGYALLSTNEKRNDTLFSRFIYVLSFIINQFR